MNKKIGISVKIIILALAVSLLFSGCTNKNDNKLKIAYQQIENNDYEGALDNLDRLSSNKIDEQELYRAKAIAYYGMGDYNNAIKYFSLVLQNTKHKLGNIEKDALFYKSASELKSGDARSALETIDSLIAIKSSWQANYQKGLILIEMGKKHEATDAFDLALKQKNDSIELYIKIFNALVSADYDKSASDYIDKAIDYCKKHKDIDNLGRLYYLNGDYAQAINTLRNQKGQQGKLYYARALYKNNDYNSCMELANKEISGNSQTKSEFLNLKGLCELQSKDYTGALKTFKEALNNKKATNELELLYNEAVAYEYLLDFTTAKQKMEELLQKYPNIKAAKREYVFLKTR